MEFIVNNWELLIAGIAVIATAAYSFYTFIKMPRSQELSKVQEWLLWAVAEAEKSFGNGTGQLKLRYVYDLFVTRFPLAAKFVTFERFSYFVDLALDKFNQILSSNKKVEKYIVPSPVIVSIEPGE